MEHDPVQSPAAGAPGAPSDDDPTARRALLVTAPNPESRLDYVIALDGRLSAAHGGPITLAVRYVPDRRVLDQPAWSTYCAAISEHTAARLESLAALILGDLANELVPRWVEVRLRHALPDGGAQAVVMQERQPRWSDAALAALLRGE